MSDIKFNRPLLILMLGYPGAGKTYFSRQFSETTSSAHLNADRIRFELYEEPQYTRDENDVVFRLMDYLTEELLNAGVSVIYDAQLNRRGLRRQKRELAKKHGIDGLIVWVQTDIDTSFERATNRDRRRIDEKYSPSLSDDVFTRLQQELQRPQNEDYVVISGKHVFKNQLNTVMNKLSRLGLLDDKQVSKNPSYPSTSLGGRVDLNRRQINIR